MAKVAAEASEHDQHVPSGALYVVATPLGNLADLTLRARTTLAHADRVLAEDTRVTATLLQHCGIATRATSLHEHNERRRIDDVLAWLAAGERVALVSDAGTPGISDPGARLVRAALDAGRRVVPIPGPSAVAAIVSVAGLAAERFAFLGFLPAQAKARRALLEAVRNLPVALVVYEAPHRVRATVAALRETLDESRTLVVGRELTKRFEEVARTTLREADAWFAADPNRERGEFVLVVDAAEPRDEDTALDAESERWLAALLDELPPSAAARVAARVTGVARDRLYARALELKGRGEAGDPDAPA
jgi:16S rRNA (cytidine1402-2'-O)-methyltransferase